MAASLVSVRCSVMNFVVVRLQFVVVCLQFVVVCCSCMRNGSLFGVGVLQCDEFCFSVFAICCSVLQLHA